MQGTSIGFHESSVVRVYRESASIILMLEDVHVGDEIRSAVLRMKGVKSIKRDGQEVQDLTAESKDGEILTLEYTESALHLIVEWSDFLAHKNHTASYRLTFDSITVDFN
jgi:hypothetical protein